MDFCQHNEVKLLIFLGWVLFLFGSLYSVLNDADAEAEAPVLWPLDGRNQLIRKDPDAGKN